MEATGVTRAQLEQAARQVGVRLSTGNGGEPVATRKGWRFTLRTVGQRPKYRRLGYRERRRKDGTTYRATVPGAVCWHGHRDFFRALYRLAPEATIRTARATYRGAEHFEDSYRGTGGNWNYYGHAMPPYSDLCDCTSSTTERG